MKASHKEKVIVMTKKEAKAAEKYGSAEYKMLVNMKRDFPNYNVEIRELSRKSASKGFSYDKMALYVNQYGTDEQKKQFEELRGTAKDTMGSTGNAYKEVKAWFNATFPEASNFAAAVARITAVA